MTSLLDSFEGYTPLEICQAIRTAILRALEPDLPTFYPYQYDASDEIMQMTLAAQGDELILDFCRQSGKTEAAVVAYLTLSVYYVKILLKDLRIGVFAPAGSQTVVVVKERLKKRYNRVRPLLEALGLKLITGEGIYSELFIIRNVKGNADARVRCLSVGKESNINAETLNLIVIEQCEDVDPLKMENDVFPMAAAVGGVTVLSGTPKSEVINTYFYKAVTSKSDKRTILKVAWEEAGKYNPRYLSYALKMRDKLGADSVAFRSQFGLEWALGVDKFTNYEALMLLERKFAIFLPTIDGKPMVHVYAGWDVAKEADHSVVTFGWVEEGKCHIIEWMEFEGTDYTLQTDEIAKRCVELGVHQICVDSAGAGDPVVDFLKRSLRQIEGGLRTRVEEIPNNVIAEEDATSKLMHEAFRHGQVDFPSEAEAKRKKNIRQRERFLEEFCDLEMHWKGLSLHLAAPEGNAYHDDYPKSCGMLLRSALKPPIKIVFRELNF